MKNISRHPGSGRHVLLEQESLPNCNMLSQQSSHLLPYVGPQKFKIRSPLADFEADLTVTLPRAAQAVHILHWHDRDQLEEEAPKRTVYAVFLL